MQAGVGVIGRDVGGPEVGCEVEYWWVLIMWKKPWIMEEQCWRIVSWLERVGDEGSGDVGILRAVLVED